MKNTLVLVSLCTTLLFSGCNTSQHANCCATCQPPTGQTVRYYNPANTNDVVTLRAGSSADGFTPILGDTTVIGNTTYKKMPPEQSK